MLHLTKVAFGSAALADITDWIAREAAGGAVSITTRYRPRRDAELDGGSLFWILRHQLVARQRILGFEAIEDSPRWRIRLSDRLVLVAPRPRRAHQGWRYLAGADAPGDLGADGAAADDLPAMLAARLSTLGLL